MPLTQAILKVDRTLSSFMHTTTTTHFDICCCCFLLALARNAIYETTWEGDNDAGQSVTQDDDHLMLRDFTFVNVQNLVEANNDIIHSSAATERTKKNWKREAWAYIPNKQERRLCRFFQIMLQAKEGFVITAHDPPCTLAFFFNCFFVWKCQLSGLSSLLKSQHTRK